MTDQHLNLFYTYNHNNQLVENNLTRALIVTLRLLSARTRHAVMESLLACSKQEILKLPDIPSFEHAEFALQSHIDRQKTRDFRQKYLVTITSYGDYTLANNDDGDPVVDDPNAGSPASVPDAWIYDSSLEYCYLIEAKIGSNPLSDEQLIAHAQDWFDISRQDIPRHLIGLSWYDVADSIHGLLNITAELRLFNEQEEHVLNALLEYLGFFGYRVFKGFYFKGLQLPPRIRLSQGQCEEFRTIFELDQLMDPPSILRLR